MAKQKETQYERLDQRLREVGKTMTDLASHLGVSRQAINNWRKRGISEKCMDATARFARCSYQWLRDGTGPRERAAELADVYALGDREIMSQEDVEALQKLHGVPDRVRLAIMALLDACNELTGANPDPKGRSSTTGRHAKDGGGIKQARRRKYGE